MKIAEDLYAYPWTQTMVNNCNTYLTSGPPVMMVDPGHSQAYGHVDMGLKEDGLNEVPDLVVLTHCHPDHIEAAFKLQEKGARLAMHPTEIEYLQGEGRQLAAAFGMSVPDVQFDVLLEEGELELGDEKFTVIHTPGHSPGHVCLYEPKNKALIAGDLVFAQGVGRVDFPGGNGELLKQSINRVAELDLEIVLPGHGPIIKGADQVRSNFEVITSMYFGML